MEVDFHTPQIEWQHMASQSREEVSPPTVQAPEHTHKY